MILFPAIDMYQGQAVRLTKGDYAQMTVYNPDPLQQAQCFEKAGAQWLHMVDLEGAKDGTTPNFSVVEEVCEKTSLQVQIGGGIRSIETIERYRNAGVQRVILGTKAVTDPQFLAQACKRFGDAIAVGVDIKDGAIAIHGWKETASMPVGDFFAQLCELGVKTVICTDISKDGMMGGSNLELYRGLSRRFALQLIASGGVSSISELKELNKMGLYGAILGKALYTGAIDLAQALREVK